MAEEQLKEVQETVDPAAPAPEAPKAEEAEQPKAEDAAPAEPKTVEAVTAEPAVEEPTPDWRDKELKKKHAQVQEGKRKLAEKEQEIADLRALTSRVPAEEEQPATDQPLPVRRAPPLAPAQPTQEQIQLAARQLREQEKYQEDLARTNDAGENAYGKSWGAALENLATLGTVEADVMSGILATDAPHKVLLELGKNPSEMQRIMELAPARRQTEFVKLSLKEVPKVKVSEAPAPTESLSGRVSPSAVPQDADDDETWYAKWNAMQDAKRKKSA